LFDERGVADLVASIGASHLLHLAWYAEPGKFWNSAENLRWVRASLSLAQAFAEAGGREMAVAGSCAEYDWTLAGGDCVEGVTPLNPATLYGASKHALRLVLEAYAREAKLRLAWGRIFLLYGPWEHKARLVPSVILPLLAGREALCSHGAQVRDFMHAADVAGAFAALLDSPVSGPVNIASGHAVPIRDLVGLLGRELGGESLIRLGALADNSPPRLVPAVDRLRREVGFRPAFTLEEGLRDAILWWRSQTSPEDSHEAHP
jgi:nucleoside-diphosphate-sugar epimerase